MDNEHIIGTVMIGRVIYTASIISENKLAVKDSKGRQVSDKELIRLICRRIFEQIL